MSQETEQTIVYTLPGCDVSERALAELRAEGIEVEERNVMRDENWFKEALRYAVSVPIVIRGGHVEVGWKGAVG